MVFTNVNSLEGFNLKCNRYIFYELQNIKLKKKKKIIILK